MKDEDLIRMEQKIDLIIQALQESGLMIKNLPNLMGIEQDVCVLCLGKIRLSVNPEEGTLTRSCNCSLPKRAYKVEITTQEKENADSRAEETQIPSD